MHSDHREIKQMEPLASRTTTDPLSDDSLIRSDQLDAVQLLQTPPFNFSSIPVRQPEVTATENEKDVRKGCLLT